jgi:hypothetical protein
MSEILVARLKKLVARAMACGYVTFEELSEVLPTEEYTSEQIKDVVVQLAKQGIELVDFPDELRPRPVEIDREMACDRSIRRIETAGTALRLGKVKFACQLVEAALAELRPFADS